MPKVVLRTISMQKRAVTTAFLLNIAIHYDGKQINDNNGNIPE